MFFGFIHVVACTSRTQDVTNSLTVLDGDNCSTSWPSDQTPSKAWYVALSAPLSQSLSRAEQVPLPELPRQPQTTTQMAAGPSPG